jgi:hypothetical protein
MNSESSFNYFEFIMLGMFIVSWAVLEWQGRRLDRKRDAEKARLETEGRK